MSRHTLSSNTLRASLLLLPLLGACVTINVYFPAAAAEKAADRIIDQVYGAGGNANAPAAPATAPKTPPNPQGALAPSDSPLASAALALLDLVVPRAEADEPDLNVTTGPIRTLIASMEGRHNALAAHYASGAIGLTADGLLELRDQNAVPLAERNTVRRLISDENADRAGLYAEIARANGHPDWAGRIRQTFARRWIEKAQSGWYYRDASGAWKQK